MPGALIARLRVIAALVCAAGVLCAPTVDAAPFFVRSVPTHRKIVALTFDDAPNEVNTIKLIQALKRLNVKSTWFLVGKHVRENPEISRQIKAAGFEIGNHSQVHVDYSKMTDADLEKDIVESQLIFYDVLGLYPSFFRPPYGRIRTQSFSILRRYYRNVIGWSVDPRDWDLAVSDQRAVNIIFNNVQPGSIILCHDKMHGRILRILPDIVEGLRRKGYTFVTVSELMNQTN